MHGFGIGADCACAGFYAVGDSRIVTMGRKAYKKGRPRADCERCDELPAEISRARSSYCAHYGEERFEWMLAIATSNGFFRH